ncbi:hypothetical protein O3W52_08935 [Ensifer psoraleae]|uniref:Uncharacterized protein n=1 Tax=Sinorhizobium psoraleae TaxID=520838 RepID=A0ABT4KDZ9_9HYPH|nr:hypothetical protein [Sinorhizobium psoraleae]
MIQKIERYKPKLCLPGDLGFSHDFKELPADDLSLSMVGTMKAE